MGQAASRSKNRKKVTPPELVGDRRIIVTISDRKCRLNINKLKLYYVGVGDVVYGLPSSVKVCII